MSSSDLSSLSSAASIASGDEAQFHASGAPGGPLDTYFKPATKAAPAPRRQRPQSPPHDYILADNPDFAFIVMFRARFSSVFPRSVPHLGPQDLERALVDSGADDTAERLLCALLGLVLNRKRDVERAHYQRPLEEAIQTHQSQWPAQWQQQSPLQGGTTFLSMTPEQKLFLLKIMILWALNSSDAVQAVIKDSYKQARHEDDLNQPLSVQAWGSDGDKRRYWLIEGQDDTHFRLYRESNPALKTNTWWSVADSIESVRGVANRLKDEGSKAAKKLSERIEAAVPRFEAGEEKRKRRDYRVARKAQFRRADPAFSMYEGRTRGKRIRYNYSDEEDGSEGGRRGSRRDSGLSTPAEAQGPVTTASGRQIRSRFGPTPTDSVMNGEQDEALPAEPNGVSGDKGAGKRGGRGGWYYYVPVDADADAKDGHAEDELGDESEAVSTENEWDGGDEYDENGAADADVTDSDDNMDEEDDDDDMDVDEPQGQDGYLNGHSLVVALRIGRERAASVQALQQPCPLSDAGVTLSNGSHTEARPLDMLLDTTASTTATPPQAPAPRPEVAKPPLPSPDLQMSESFKTSTVAKDDNGNGTEQRNLPMVDVMATRPWPLH